jgi:hypothetical protein
MHVDRNNVYVCKYINIYMYSWSVIKSIKMRRAGHVAQMGEACKGFWWGKPEGKGPMRRPRRRWVDNIKMDPQEVGCGGMDWIKLAQDRDRWRALANAIMNFWVS